MTLMLTPDANRANFADLGRIPVPSYTRSYRPVPYQDAVEIVRHAIDQRLDREVLNEEFALGRKGKHLFAQWTLDTDVEGNNLSIGMRQSLDKSFALGLVSGGEVTVCSNLMFVSSSIKCVRKNTTNVLEDFRLLVESAVDASEGIYTNVQTEIQAMQRIELDTVRGAEIMGVALYDGILRPQQATIAMTAWRDAPHPEFQPRNLWSLYNAFTEALKKGQPVDTMDRYTATHDFFQGLYPVVLDA